MHDKSQHRKRIDAIDIARGIALLAMAIYHFTWDLGFFGYVEPTMATTGGWKIFARCIASSFLFLAGVSLYLAHAEEIRWPGFWRRLAMVGGAALAISAATYIATPTSFIFFGILHHIALASLLGLAFLRLPAMLTFVVAVMVIAAPHFFRSELFDPAWWWWTGLSAALPKSNDYVPLFPWFGAVLAGIATAKISMQAGLIPRLAGVRIGAWGWPAILAGRHSLAFYLIHQPVLIACVWVYAQIMPPAIEAPAVRFVAACEAACNETRDTEFCTRYCACMIDRLERDGLIDGLFAGGESAETRSRVEEAADLCTVETDNAILEGDFE